MTASVLDLPHRDARLRARGTAMPKSSEEMHGIELPRLTSTGVNGGHDDTGSR